MHRHRRGRRDHAGLHAALNAGGPAGNYSPVSSLENPCYIGDTMNEAPKDDRKPEPPRRLPYERPAVVSDEVFETLALSCANAPRLCSPSSPNQS